MEFFNPNANIQFMAWRKITVGISAFLILASIVLLATRGLDLALDFTGGTLVEAEFEQPVEIEAVRAALDKGGFQNFTVQSIGGAREAAMRLPPMDKGESVGVERQREVAEAVANALNAAGLKATVKRSEFVGPQVGKELAEDGIIAVVFVILTIMLYVAVRFEWRFGLAAIAGEAHDVIIALGFVSLMGISFDLTVLAGLLTVAGYSINDKVVVFDRVREIFRSARKLGPEDTINKAVNNTLSRTIITGITTFFALFSLYFLGGPVVEGFAMTVIFGIVVGTLSSIFFCNPILLWLGVSKSDLQTVRKEDPELALRP
ncbi:MAG: protein translocase subunit SecF [Rhodanobacteraceae bacterium]|nr:protein translocase subunit SecF [Rhodanobacteraceae bacterium]